MKIARRSKFEILRHERSADLAENNVGVLNRQIESQVLEIGQTIAGLTDGERARRDSRIRSFHEMADLKRAHELRVDEFSEGKWIENHNVFTGPRYRNCIMRVVV